MGVSVRMGIGPWSAAVVGRELSWLAVRRFRDSEGAPGSSTPRRLWFLVPGSWGAGELSAGGKRVARSHCARISKIPQNRRWPRARGRCVAGDETDGRHTHWLALRACTRNAIGDGARGPTTIRRSSGAGSFDSKSAESHAIEQGGCGPYCIVPGMNPKQLRKSGGKPPHSKAQRSVVAGIDATRGARTGPEREMLGRRETSRRCACGPGGS